MIVTREHIIRKIKDPIFRVNLPSIVFKKRRTDGLCASFNQYGNTLEISTSYYVGADWLPGNESQHWLFVEPKLNTKFDQDDGLEIISTDVKEPELKRIDTIQMLFEALSHPEVYKHTDELFEIKFDSPRISIPHNDDLLSPLLIIQFLKVVKEIVRKGLKKSYYKTNQNLYAKVKGKILVGQTIKQNLAKNKILNTYCQFEEFGENGLENRLLKKALLFVRRYLYAFKGLENHKFFTEAFYYIQPAFEHVSPDVELHDIKHFKFNAFYKDYEEAIRLAKLILQRFGYNLQSIKESATIDTPPYWIDMSKLFELYVLGKLNKAFPNKIKYHFKASGNELDYLFVKGEDSLVIDSKYKPNYKAKTHQGYHEDIRQVSGYARLKEVRKEAGQLGTEKQLGCLIIYPDQTAADSLPQDLKSTEIEAYEGVWKLGVRLPDLDKRDKQK